MSARKVILSVLKKLYRDKKTISEIQAHFRCSRSSVTENLNRLKELKRRGKGWKPPGYGARLSAALQKRSRGSNL